MILVFLLLKDACVGLCENMSYGFDSMLSPCLVFGLDVASSLRVATAIGLAIHLLWERAITNFG
jgi:hypothetical protein